MKKLIILVLPVILFACHKKDQYEKCAEFKATTQQYSYAISNYQDFEGYANFYKNVEWDSVSVQYVDLPLKDGFWIRLKELNSLCIPNNTIGFYNILPKVNDTIFLHKIHYGSGLGHFPLDTSYADYSIADYDAGIDDYIIIPQEKFRSWLVLQSINSDTTLISGTFQMGMSRLHPDRHKDDPLRPDTLYFVHGYFRAEFTKNKK